MFVLGHIMVLFGTYIKLTISTNNHIKNEIASPMRPFTSRAGFGEKIVFKIRLTENSFLFIT